MNYSFHVDAEKELYEAIVYYNDRQNGLGLDFAKEVYLAIQSILSFPLAWAPLSVNTQRCLTNRFPYGVIYQVTDGGIFIIGVMHLNREPSYWKNREKKA